MAQRRVQPDERRSTRARSPSRSRAGPPSRAPAGRRRGARRAGAGGAGADPDGPAAEPTDDPAAAAVRARRFAAPARRGVPDAARCRRAPRSRAATAAGRGNQNLATAIVEQDGAIRVRLRVGRRPPARRHRRPPQPGARARALQRLQGDRDRVPDRARRPAGPTASMPKNSAIALNDQCDALRHLRGRAPVRARHARAACASPRDGRARRSPTCATTCARSRTTT